MRRDTSRCANKSASHQGQGGRGNERRGGWVATDPKSSDREQAGEEALAEEDANLHKPYFDHRPGGSAIESAVGKPSDTAPLWVSAAPVGDFQPGRRVSPIPAARVAPFVNDHELGGQPNAHVEVEFVPRPRVPQKPGSGRAALSEPWSLLQACGPRCPIAPFYRGRLTPTNHQLAVAQSEPNLDPGAADANRAQQGQAVRTAGGGIPNTAVVSRDGELCEELLEDSPGGRIRRCKFVREEREMDQNLGYRQGVVAMARVARGCMRIQQIAC
eukprot:scaffold2668_cov115-Isochrysis_galbana.AAC.27